MSPASCFVRPTRGRGYVLAHGAGAGMRHRFMEAIAEGLARRGMATLRYQFPYMETGGRRPDPPGVLEATVRAAVNAARELLPGLPLVAGGKSLGGRMTSNAQAREPLPGVSGLVFLGFPLHPPKQPGVRAGRASRRRRASHAVSPGHPRRAGGAGSHHRRLPEIGPRATLHVVEGADHAFAVLKRSGRSDAEVHGRAGGHPVHLVPLGSDPLL